MFLKVEINGKEDFYAFKGQDVVKIGRSPVSDIQIINDGVSRNHIEIRCIDGDFFIFDRGSTNGTFINEEELKVDEQYPFNTFFPVRLGFDVLIYLLDEVSVEQLEIMSQNSLKKDTQDLSDFSRTSIASIAQVSNSGTKRIKREKKKVEKKERGKGSFLNAIKALVIVIAVGFFFQEEIMNVISPKEVIVKKVEKKVIEKEPEVIIKNDPPSPLQVYGDIVTSDKCLDIKLETLCKKFKAVKVRNYYEGLILKNDTLYVVIDPATSLEHFKKNSPKYSNEEREFALLTLARNPRFQSLILPNGRYEKNNTIDVYKFKTGKIKSYSEDFYNLVIYSEMLFGEFGNFLQSSSFKNIEFVFYKILDNDYRFKANYKIEMKDFDLKGSSLVEITKGVKFALFNEDNQVFSRIKNQKRNKYKR